MPWLAVLLVSIGVLGIVGAQPAAPAASAASGTEIYSAAAGVSDLLQPPSELTASAGSDRWPAPSPDGSRVAFVRDQDGFDSLYLMRSDGSEQTQLFSPTPPPDAIADTLDPPVWSPDGTALLVTENVYMDPYTDFASLHLIPLDGSAARTIGPGLETQVSGAFSPDGRYVAYQTGASSSFAAENDAVGVVAPDGTWRTLGHGTHASWSPRRDRLAYRASASGYLTVVDPDGRHRWTLRTMVAEAFTWSPGGRLIAFLRRQGGALTLFLCRPGSRRLRRVITLPDTNQHFYLLSWSADGRWLAATAPAYTLTLLVHPEGSGFTAITDAAAVAWAPRGHTLAFEVPNGSEWNLMTWPSRQLIDQAPAGGGYQGIAWSPDGTRLIFARGASTP